MTQRMNWTRRQLAVLSGHLQEQKQHVYAQQQAMDLLRQKHRQEQHCADGSDMGSFLPLLIQQRVELQALVNQCAVLWEALMGRQQAEEQRVNRQIDQEKVRQN